MKAFPHEEWLDSTDPQVLNPIRHPGMDLRDYFAAKAMQGILSTEINDRTLTRHDYGSYCMTLAICSYQLADAMMEYRK